VQQGNECFNKRTNRRIKACVPMHTFGRPCRIEQIVGLCNEHNIEIIEDAAESMGSFFRGKHTGTYGRIGVLSFNGNKTITCGGGGALLFNDEKLGQQAKHLSTQAKVPHPWEVAHNDIGYNYRMPNVNAAIGLAQLEQLDTYVTAKRKLAKIYEEFFGSLDVKYASEPADSKSNYWLNVILLKDSSEREAFLNYCHADGIMARPVWKLMNKLPMFDKCQTDALANSMWLEERIVNIPSSVRIKMRKLRLQGPSYSVAFRSQSCIHLSLYLYCLTLLKKNKRFLRLHFLGNRPFGTSRRWSVDIKSEGK